LSQSCSECTEPMLAQSLCTLCNKWLCYQCTDVHQHQRPSVTSQFSDLHPQQRTSSVQCPGSHPCLILMCHSHRQEPLELFCESCDLLCCSSCHLSSHKNHRVVQTGKALQDQQWLFESLMVQVEERRSAVENSAKQIEDRLHGVTVARRKAENQIKMAKMIMMNELNKRANLLIEQLEKISEDFQQHLEDQLQGAIDACSQLDHVQKFITWALTHHCRGPVLFSRSLISFQMQQLLDQSLGSDSWSPPKIKFNWDASYWTKQISSFGKLTAEGGNCTYPPALACSSILRPQPVTCLSLPPVCHRGREPGYGYQACCEPQRCCLHGIPSQSDLSSLDKNQLDVSICNSSCIPPAHIAAPLHQNQQPQRYWDRENLPQLHPSSSPVPVLGLNCSRGSTAQPQVGPSQPQSLTKSHFYHQSPAEADRSTQCQGKLSPSAGLPRELTAADAEYMTEEMWEDRCRLDEPRGQTLRAGSRELVDDVLLQRDGRETAESPVDESGAAVEQRHTDAERAPRRQGETPGFHLNVLEQAMWLPVLCDTSFESGLFPMQPRCSNTLKAANLTHKHQTPSVAIAGLSSALAALRSLKELFRTLALVNLHMIIAVVTKPATAFTTALICAVSCVCLLMCVCLTLLGLFFFSTSHSLSLPFVFNDVKQRSTSLEVSVTTCERGADMQSSRISPSLVCTRKQRSQSIPAELSAPSTGPLSERLIGCTGDRETRAADAVTRNHSTIIFEGGCGGCMYSLVGSDWLLNVTDTQTWTTRVSAQAFGRPLVATSRNCQIKKKLDQSLNHTNEKLDHDTKEKYSISRSGHRIRVPVVCLERLKILGESSSEAELQHLAEETSAAAGGTGPCTGTDTTDSEPSLEYEGDPESDPGAGSEGGQEVESAESDVQPDCQAETDSEANPVAQRGPEDSDDTGMESEDFCAVCLIGGDLLCCDRCPKVFHLSCHVPPLLSFPSGDWVCSLCREVEYDCENERTSGEQRLGQGLSAGDQRKCERLTLLILSNILSAPFHEPVSPLARHYYQIIKRPMDLSVIRAKLSKSHAQHYLSPDQFIADVFLMFRNCAKFNYPDSEVAQAGRSLEAFFISQLRQVFPDRAFPVAQEDSDSDEYDEACRAAGGGFPWPERREQCHRKRKRRNSLKSRR
uniref:Tripartite motif containing 66 n=1 Tax=Tetraodon nigroviridis TaxID=99883 RepID=H3C4I7_TETNG